MAYKIEYNVGENEHRKALNDKLVKKCLLPDKNECKRTQQYKRMENKLHIEIVKDFAYRGKTNALNWPNLPKQAQIWELKIGISLEIKN